MRHVNHSARPTHLAVLLAVALVAGCKNTFERNTTPPPIPKLPNYGGMAEQVVSWLPEGAQVTLAYMDLTHVESVQGKAATKTIRQTYPDRMDVYLANAARFLQPTKKITVVDRRNMTHFLTEQKLQASDMVPFDPASRVKLKKITAVNTYVYWKVVREGDIEEWVLRAVAVETGEVYGGLVHRFRVPDEFKVQPRLGDLTVDSFTQTRPQEQFRLALRGKPKAMVAVGRAIERDEVRHSHRYDPEVWYVKAGEAGYAEGFYRIGELYYGKIYRYSKVKKVTNWATAIKWYQKAADMGHVKALTKLGWMHFKGEGTAVDLAQARVYYLKGAQGGNATAMNQIGYLLGNGKGGDADPKRAVHWYRQSAVNGNGTAAMNLGHMYSNGRGVEKDEAAAVRWYRKSAWANYGPGMTALALMYEKGRGVPRNLQTAYDWLVKARKAGCRAAYDHKTRVWAALNQQKAQAKQRAIERRAQMRATPWVVIPHSLKLWEYAYNRGKDQYLITTLNQGEQIHVLGTGHTGSGGEYWKVLYKSREGYVRAGMLKQLPAPAPGTKPEPKTPTVKTSDKKGEF